MEIGILWDLDGTLLDTLEDLKDAVNHVLVQYGCPERTRGEIRSFLGNGAANLISRSLPDTQTAPPLQPVLKDYLAYYQEHSQVKTAPYPGICEALARISHPMAVVSNKPDEAVKLLGQNWFPGLYALGESREIPRKPAPDMVKRAMEELGVQKGVFVGDSEVDILTAQNAGLPCLSVLWGFRDREDLEAAGGRYFCRTPEELPEMLEKIIGEVYGE